MAVAEEGEASHRDQSRDEMKNFYERSNSFRLPPRREHIMSEVIEHMITSVRPNKKNYLELPAVATRLLRASEVKLFL